MSRASNEMREATPPRYCRSLSLQALPAAPDGEVFAAGVELRRVGPIVFATVPLLA